MAAEEYNLKKVLENSSEKGCFLLRIYIMTKEGIVSHIDIYNIAELNKHLQ